MPFESLTWLCRWLFEPVRKVLRLRTGRDRRARLPCPHAENDTQAGGLESVAPPQEGGATNDLPWLEAQPPTHASESSNGATEAEVPDEGTATPSKSEVETESAPSAPPVGEHEPPSGGAAPSAPCDAEQPEAQEAEQTARLDDVATPSAASGNGEAEDETDQAAVPADGLPPDESASTADSGGASGAVSEPSGINEESSSTRTEEDTQPEVDAGDARQEGSAPDGPPAGPSASLRTATRAAPSHSSCPQTPFTPARRVSEGPRQPREPWRFGARRHSEGSPIEPREVDHPRPPELRCYREGSEWAIFLRVAPDLGVTDVRLGGEVIVGENGEYRLPRFRGAITLTGRGGESMNVPLFDGREPLVFRLSGSGDSSSGRQCRRITTGRFLVIAPRTASRTSEGYREEDECSDGQFLAHFVTARKEDSAESLGAIGRWRLGTDRTASLTGATVFDSSDEGELFVGEPPKLKSDEGIEWARVGEERDGGWQGQNFLANEESLADVLGNRRGRFFLRTYPLGSTALADSTAFRYWPDLKEIQVNGEPFREDLVMIPPGGGTKPTSVELAGRFGPLVPRILSKHARLDRGTVCVEPSPDGDEVRLLLGDVTSRMNVVVNLPRVWWRLQGSTVWTQEPIKMARREFRASPDALEVLAPFAASGLSAGLDGQYRSFPTVRDGGHANRFRCVIPFTSFTDDPVLQQNVGTDLVLRIRVAGNETAGVPTLVLTRDPLRQDPIGSGANALPVTLIRRMTPEIRQGAVEIRALGRIPGVRSKVAVISKALGVDPVTICRGPADSRVHAVSRELDGECVELIPWDDDVEALARSALHPVRVLSIRPLSRDGLLIRVLKTHETDARGWNAQNKHLAEELLGLRVSILPVRTQR